MNNKKVIALYGNDLRLSSEVRDLLKLPMGGKVNVELVNNSVVVSPYFDPEEWATQYLAVYGLYYQWMTYRNEKDGITVVRLSKFKTGVAFCSPNDTYNSKIGEAIALARALGSSHEIPNQILN